jgi:S-adenosyl methyltransferase
MPSHAGSPVTGAPPRPVKDNGMKRDDFADIDTKTASGARVYDYLLGGTDNYAIDRMAADQVESILPGTKAMARNSRRFLERVIRYLAGDGGIRQFIDNGSGLPTQDNVHQIAQRLAPDSRVVYIDSDPIAVRHHKVSALAENQNTAFILSDARDTERILDHPDTRRLIDFGQPTAVLYFMFLHFIPDDSDPAGMIRDMMGRLAPGSYLAISHVVSDQAKVRQQMTEISLANTRGNFGRIRSSEEVRAFFDGLDPAEPGLVDIRDWRPDGQGEEQADQWYVFGGVARKQA